jgi:hypothetical protein
MSVRLAVRDLCEHIVITGVVHMAMAVEEHDFVDIVVVTAREGADGLALLGSGSGVEEVQPPTSPVDGDRRQVWVIPHGVRVVSLDEMQVIGDGVNGSCTHDQTMSGPALIAISRRSYRSGLIGR